MKGIVEILPYIPRSRIRVETLAKAWGQPAKPGERAVANYDEDSLTMAVAALSQARDPELLTGVHFATTTSPVGEGGCASMLAFVLNLPDDAATADFGTTLRSGTTALRTVFAGGNFDYGRTMAVVASDTRRGQPGNEIELQFGDAACAVIAGSEGVIAKWLGSASHNSVAPDAWRPAGQQFVQQADAKFALKESFLDSIGHAVNKLLKDLELSIGQIDWLVIPGATARQQQAAYAKTGFSGKVPATSRVLHEVGNCGAALPFLLLHETLLQAEPGDKVLLIGYGAGADAILFEVTEEVGYFKENSTLFRQLDRKCMIGEYARFLDMKGNLERETLVPYSTPVYAWRERETNLRLKAQVCRQCGTIQFPERRICTHCRTRDDFVWRSLQKSGVLFTFTHDYLVPGLTVPTTMAVVDLDGGGRLFTQMTDSDPKEVRIGMRVSLEYRKFHEGGGFANYFWKAVPSVDRGGAQ